MRNSNPVSRIPGLPTLVMVAILAFAACDRQDVIAPQEAINENHAQPGPAAISDANVVEIIAAHHGDDYVFEMPETLPTGWTTFELDNHSQSTHFAFFARVPGDAIQGAEAADMDLLEYWIENVTDPFQDLMDGILAQRDMDELFGEFLGSAAGWFFDPGPVPAGGPGFVAGLESTRTTVYLEPGYYIVECYVKDAEGQFHSARGMINLLEVDGSTASSTPEPRATVDVTVASTGIEAQDRMRPGLHNVRVNFADQAEYGHLLGHDLHLIRLNGADVEEVARWMNWMAPAGLESSSRDRGPQTFLGGVQTMLPGGVGYMTVRLEPGEYAWIAEVPHPDDDPFNDTPMWKTFAVPGGR